MSQFNCLVFISACVIVAAHPDLACTFAPVSVTSLPLLALLLECVVVLPFFHDILITNVAPQDVSMPKHRSVVLTPRQ